MPEFLLMDDLENIFEDLTSTVFWVCDVQDSKCHFVSKAYETVWGRKPQDIVNEQDLYHFFSSSLVPFDYALNEKEFYRPTQRQKSSITYFRIVRQDGKIRHIKNTSFTLFKEGNLPRKRGRFPSLKEASKPLMKSKMVSHHYRKLMLNPCSRRSSLFVCKSTRKLLYSSQKLA